MSDTDELESIEKKSLGEMRMISSMLDSYRMELMYAAAGKMMSHPQGRAFVARALGLSASQDATIRRVALRTLARQAFGPYIVPFFSALQTVNPAEREQVLQVIEETMRTVGAPTTTAERDKWTRALLKFVREHQATVIGILACLGSQAMRSIERLFTEQPDVIDKRSVHKVMELPPEPGERLSRVLARAAVTKRRDILEPVCEILNAKTVQLVAPALKSDRWEVRALVARAVGRAGIVTQSGVVSDILSDSDWRVKQTLLENIDVEKSKFSALTRVLEILVSDSHIRVRSCADRVLLILGTKPCMGSDVETQRARLMKRFRKQLLRSAPHNKDLDTDWLGTDTSTVSHIPFIPEEAEGPTEEAPQGISLGDLLTSRRQEEDDTSERKRLLAALLSERSKLLAAEAQKKTVETVQTQEATPASRVLAVLKEVSESGEVELAYLKQRAMERGMTAEDFDAAVEQLEREGIVYRSGKGAVRYVDLQL
ncbi:MAG: hypothetical protein QXS20_03365 [Candidatus Thorarchaeota archaeon]